MQLSRLLLLLMLLSACWAPRPPVEAWTAQDLRRPRQTTSHPSNAAAVRLPHIPSGGVGSPSLPAFRHPSTEPLLSASRKRTSSSSVLVTRQATAALLSEASSSSSSRRNGNGSKPRDASVDAPSRQAPSSSDYYFSSRSSSPSPPGLTREQETSWTFCIRRFRTVVRMRDQLARERDGRAPAEAEWAEHCGLSVMELRKAMQQGQQAREALVSANVGLVTSIAKRHYQALKRAASSSSSTLRPTLADLIQEGNVGILSAAERFQPEKGFRFSTYATWWIRQRIVRSIGDSSRIIRLPAHVQSTLTRMYKARRGLSARLGRDPTPSELAHELDMSVEKLQRYTDSSRHVLSLEVPLRAAAAAASSSSKPDRRTLMDVLASDAPTPEEDAQSNYLRRDIQAVMENELAERERHVISHRFGLVDGKSRSHAETAKLLGISRDRVRLVEARALNKLRSPQRNYRLKEYVVTSTSTATAASSSASSSAAASSAAASLVSSLDAAAAKPEPTFVYQSTTTASAAAMDEASSPWPSSTPPSFASKQPGSDRIWFF